LTPRKRALFICTGNRARSQMAEGLLRHLAGDRFEVHSAGILPTDLAELSVAAMKELGIDIASQWSKSVDEFVEQDFDYIITVCDTARGECPVFPGEGQRLHWSVEDPSDIEARGYSLPDGFRMARDDLKARIEEFLRDQV
jgi:arsenate reductase